MHPDYPSQDQVGASPHTPIARALLAWALGGLRLDATAPESPEASFAAFHRWVTAQVVDPGVHTAAEQILAVVIDDQVRCEQVAWRQVRAPGPEFGITTERVPGLADVAASVGAPVFQEAAELAGQVLRVYGEVARVYRARAHPIREPGLPEVWPAPAVMGDGAPVLTLSPVESPGPVAVGRGGGVRLPQEAFEVLGTARAAALRTALARFSLFRCPRCLQPGDPAEPANAIVYIRYVEPGRDADEDPLTPPRAPWPEKWTGELAHPECSTPCIAPWSDFTAPDYQIDTAWFTFTDPPMVIIQRGPLQHPIGRPPAQLADREYTQLRGEDAILIPATQTQPPPTFVPATDVQWEWEATADGLTVHTVRPPTSDGHIYLRGPVPESWWRAARSSPHVAVLFLPPECLPTRFWDAPSDTLLSEAQRRSPHGRLIIYARPAPRTGRSAGDPGDRSWEAR